jgi:hypothetical protein
MLEGGLAHPTLWLRATPNRKRRNKGNGGSKERKRGVGFEKRD